jgi:hypothetical protein
MGDTFPISGQIDPKAFPFLLMDLREQGATGSLKVDGPSYQKALYFRGGRILFGSSNDPRDQLGAILIEAGKITPEQLEDVNTKVGPGNPLAKVLSDTGFVSQRELSEAARAKVERILSDVIAYPAGSFEFEDGVLPKGAIDLKLSTERLVLDAVRRISDRNFVLRYLEGLDVRLTRTTAGGDRAEEVDDDAASLLPHLDGRTTLREAAARTRLEEFEAAKVACGLLFLGWVQRGDHLAATGFALSESGPEELDLGEAATAPFRVGSDADRESQEPAFFLDPPAASAAPKAAGIPATANTPSLPFVPPPAPGPAPAGARAIASGLPLVPPPAKDGPIVRTPPAPSQPWAAGAPDGKEDSEATRPAARPSKDDLAALDALLNSRTLEGPLAPMERAPVDDRWTPQFGHGRTTGRHAVRGGGSKVKVLAAAGAAALLVAIVGYWFFTRPEPRPSPGATTRASASPALPAPVVVRSTQPSAGPSAAPRPLTSAPPPVTSAPPPVTAAPAGGGNDLGTSRSLMRQGRLQEAAVGFAVHVRRAPAGTFSVQLLVACSAETVQKAVATVDSPELFILPVHYQGRDCFRMCWGLYPSGNRALSAAQSLPEYFRVGGAKPRVLSAAELLP